MSVTEDVKIRGRYVTEITECQRCDHGWRLGLVVGRWSRSTKLLYAGPG